MSGRRAARSPARPSREERLARRIAEDLSPEWAAEADRGNLSAEAVRSLAGMPKERQAEMHAAMEPWRRTKRELSDYVRSEGKTQAGPDGRIAKAARLVADFLESPPESPSAADLTLLREMALMTAGQRCPKAPQKGFRFEIQQVAYGVRHRVGRP